MMAPALHLVPGWYESAHLAIESLRLVPAGAEFFGLADQKEVIVEFFLRTPVCDNLLLHFVCSLI